ncbi:MAG: translation initiation factor IF-1 [Verrucomicrobiota bacterium]
MAGESAFKVEGLIVEVLPRDTFRAELSNGHRLLAFLPAKSAKHFAGLKPGDRVRLQMSPGDLSQGRIIVETKQI